MICDYLLWSAMLLMRLYFETDLDGRLTYVKLWSGYLGTCTTRVFEVNIREGYAIVDGRIEPDLVESELDLIRMLIKDSVVLGFQGHESCDLSLVLKS